jgi:hypothetical protein
MNRIYYTTSSPLTKVLVLILAAVLLFASHTVATEIDRAHAEEITTPGFILCKSYVVIRQWASKRATEIGQLDPAEPIEIDGRTKDGYAHIVEPCDGWVWAGYITFSEPQKIDAPGVVTAKKRVAARRWCDGPNVDSKPWLISGSEVRIYWMCDDWALTNRGYVKSEWLEVDGDV